ncbi:MAG: hypothetical protein ACRES0_22255 [Pseudomonas sp.]
MAELARELGLRSKEAALLNAHKALQEARERGQEQRLAHDNDQLKGPVHDPRTAEPKTARQYGS